MVPITLKGDLGGVVVFLVFVLAEVDAHKAALAAASTSEKKITWALKAYVQLYQNQKCLSRAVGPSPVRMLATIPLQISSIFIKLLPILAHFLLFCYVGT